MIKSNFTSWSKKKIYSYDSVNLLFQDESRYMHILEQVYHVEMASVPIKKQLEKFNFYLPKNYWHVNQQDCTEKFK